MYACPRCDAPSTPDHCPTCGRGPEPLLAELAELDARLRTDEAERAQLKTRLDNVVARIKRTSAARSTVLGQLSRRASQLREAPTPRPVKSVSTMPHMAPPPPMQAPSPSNYVAPPPMMARPPEPIPGPPPPEQTHRSAQNILLSLGGILSAAAVIIFTAVAWATFGVTGRAIILTVLTAALLAVPFWLTRRGLRSTAETLAGLGLLMVLCDAIAVYYLDVFPGLERGWDKPTIVVLSVAVVIIALVYRIASGFVVTGYAISGLAVPAIIIALMQASTPAGTAALIALVGVLAAASYWTGANPNGVSAINTRVTTALNGGMAVAALATTSLFLMSNIADDYTLLGVACTIFVALLLSLVLTEPWQIGPRISALFLGGVTLLLAASTAAFFAIKAIPFNSPAWHSEAVSPPLPGTWQVLPILILLGIAMSRFLPQIGSAVVRYGSIGLAVIAFGPTTGLPWAVTCIVSIVAAIIGAAYALQTPPTRAAWVLPTASGITTLHALATSMASPNSALLASGLASTAAITLSINAVRIKSWLIGPFTAVAIWLTGCAWMLGLWRIGARGDTFADIVVLPFAAMTLAVSWRIAVLAQRPSQGPKADTTAWRNRRIALLGVVAASMMCVAITLTAIDESGIAGSTAIALLVTGITCVIFGLKPTAKNNRIFIAAAGVTVLFATASLIDLAIEQNILTIIVLAVGLLAVSKHTSNTEQVQRGLSTAATIVIGLCTLGAAILAITGWASALTPINTDIPWTVPVVLAIAAASCFAITRIPWPTEIATLLVTLALGAIPAVLATNQWWLAATIIAALGAANLIWSVYAKTIGRATSRYALGLTTYIWAVTASTTGNIHLDTRLKFSAYLVLALVLVTILIAALGKTRTPTLGGLSVSIGIIAFPLGTWIYGNSAHWPDLALPITALGATAIGLIAASGLYYTRSTYLPWATAVLPLTATLSALTSLPSTPVGVPTATAGLIGIGAAMLMLPDRAQAWFRTAASIIPLVISTIASITIAIQSIVVPYTWIGGIGARTPTSTIDGLSPIPMTSAGDTWDVAALLIVATATVLAIFGLIGRRWAIGTLIAAAAIVVPTIPVILDAPWPTLPITATVLAIAGYVIAGVVPLQPTQRILPLAVAIILGGSGISGALAAPSATLTVFGLLAITTIVIALVATTTEYRCVSWVLSAFCATAFMTALGTLIALPQHLTGIGLAGIAGLYLAVSALRLPRIGAANRAVETSGYITAAAAIIAASTQRPTLAIVLVVLGAILALLSFRAGTNVSTSMIMPSWGYTWAAILCGIIAYWLILSDAGITMVEPYTVPFALLTVVGGWLELRRRPQMRSWLAYGPGLLLSYGPTLALVLTTPDEPWRRLLLGTAVLVVLLLGVWRRLQAPVIISGVVLVVLAIRELALLWSAVPFWAPLAIGGVILLVLGATFEKRRRDVVRLKDALAQMR